MAFSSRSGNMANPATKPSRPGRVLATIVFTDAVNFSGRMNADESRTVHLIHRDLAFITKTCEAHGGRVLKNTGDGLLIYFGSAGQAIESAMKVQAAFAKAADAAPAGSLLQHRIGIHLGDVFLTENDVIGEGVNVAARVLTEAEPGGICFSQTVYDVVKNRLGVKATRTWLWGSTGVSRRTIGGPACRYWPRARMRRCANSPRRN